MTGADGSRNDVLRAFGRDYAVWVFLVAVAVALLPYLVPSWAHDKPEWHAPYNLEVLLAGAGVVACFAGRRRLRDPHARRFWDFMGAAFVVWLISMLPVITGSGWGWDVTIDLVNLGFYFLAFAALAVRPDARPARLSVLTRLHLAAAATTLVGLTVYFTIIPASSSPAEYSSWVPHLAVVLVLDLCLVFATLRAASRARGTPWRRIYLILASAWILFLGTDSLNSAWRLGIWDISLGTPIDLLWVVPFFPFTFGARWAHLPRIAGLQPVRAEHAEERSARTVFAYAATFLLIHALISGTGLLSPSLVQVRTWTVVIVCSVLGFVAFAYERALAEENRRLRTARDAAIADAERAQLMRELEARQRLESLGVLAGGVAHDFNNVLQSIVGNTDLLQASLVDPAAKKLAGQIDEAAGRAKELVEQILSYAGQQRTDPEPIDLNYLVGEILNLVPLPIRNRARFRLRLDERPVTVEGDATQLRQVALNLVVNACEALDGPGVVTICTRRQGERAVLEVRDTGVGMDEDTRARMFEPFFTDKSEGRGLGLAATWGIVRNHQGEIVVSSRPGRGTRIAVSLPGSDATPTLPSAHPELALPPIDTDARFVTVLVVDDEPQVASLLRTALEKRGHAVVTAGDGRAGLQALAEHPDVALTFLDLSMPGMEAPEVMHAIRERRPDLPVVIMTGYDRATALPRLSRYEPEAFLYKPFRLNDLFAVTAQVLRAREAIHGVPDPVPDVT